jgi:hypothetical protein
MLINLHKNISVRKPEVLVNASLGHWFLSDKTLMCGWMCMCVLNTGSKIKSKWDNVDENTL